MNIGGTSDNLHGHGLRISGIYDEQPQLICQETIEVIGNFLPILTLTIELVAMQRYSDHSIIGWIFLFGCIFNFSQQSINYACAVKFDTPLNYVQWASKCRWDLSLKEESGGEDKVWGIVIFIMYMKSNCICTIWLRKYIIHSIHISVPYWMDCLWTTSSS